MEEQRQIHDMHMTCTVTIFACKGTRKPELLISFLYLFVLPSLCPSTPPYVLVEACMRPWEHAVLSRDALDVEAPEISVVGLECLNVGRT
jgi:hypothetical protein